MSEGRLADYRHYRPGSREDFDRLYRECYPRLVRTVYAVVGEAGAAEDCVQEAFVKAYKAWPRFRPERPAEAWIHQIAINTAISHRRRERLREVGEVVRRLGRPAAGRDPAQEVVEGDLVRALAALPAKLSVPFALRHYHGYTNREIVAMTGVPERTVGLRLAQARDQLRRRLGPGWAEERGLPTRGGPGVVVACRDAPDAG